MSLIGIWRIAHRSSRLMRLWIVGLATTALIFGLRGAPVASLAMTRGRAVIWTDTRGGESLAVLIDGHPVGTLVEYFSSGVPDCSAKSGVVSLKLGHGAHQLAARDQAGRAWASRIVVPRSACVIIRLARPGQPRNNGSVPADSPSIKEMRVRLPPEAIGKR